MVDIGGSQERHGPSAGQQTTNRAGHGLRRGPGTMLAAGALLVGAVVLIAALAGESAPAQASSRSAPSSRMTPSPSSRAAASPAPTITSTSAAPAGGVSAPSPATTAPSAASAAPAAPAAPAGSVAAVVPPTVAALVAQVEAAGILPGPGWSWSMGDPTAHCGAINAAGLATGCTFWASGVETTVFAGTPSLALVAHEVANAETEHSALPGLLSQVAAAAVGTSWSPTDAVASCLVEHFLGIQDDAAGSWQCPATLATTVADHIHDTVTVTQTTAVCGTASGVSSTLTFSPGTGTLSVTSPGAAAVTAPAGAPVTVSGIGTFVATDQGGTISVAGACEA